MYLSTTKCVFPRIKVYSPEKILADCFKFRNKIGMNVVLEALKLYKTRKKFDLGELLKYAKICRVEKVMRPFPPANQVPQTGSHPAHGPEPMDSHQEELIGVCSTFKNFWTSPVTCRVLAGQFAARKAK